MKAKGRRRESSRQRHFTQHPLWKRIWVFGCVSNHSQRDKPTLNVTQSHPEFKATVTYQLPACQHGGTATPKELGKALIWLNRHIFRGQPPCDTRKWEGARGFCSSCCHGTRLLGSSFHKAFFSPAKISPTGSFCLQCKCLAFPPK